MKPSHPGIITDTLGNGGEGLSDTGPVGENFKDIVDGLYRYAKDAGEDAVFIRHTADWNPANAADAAGVSGDFPVPGVALGDFVVGVAVDQDLAGAHLTAQVTAAGVVTARIDNKSGAGVNLDTEIHFLIVPLAWASKVGLVASYAWTLTDTDLDDAQGETSADVAVHGAVLGDKVVVSSSIDIVDCILTGYVKDEDVVVARLQNESAASNLANLAPTVYFLVLPRGAGTLRAIEAEADWNPANLANQATDQTLEIDVEGAEVGDIALPAFSLDLAGGVLTAHVFEQGKVNFVLTNYNADGAAGALNLAAGKAYVTVLPKDAPDLADYCQKKAA
jgi:hypothetical protein